MRLELLRKAKKACGGEHDDARHLLGCFF